MKILHLSSARSWRGGESQLSLLLHNAPSEVNHIVCAPAGSMLINYCKEQNIPHITYHKRASMDPVFSWKLKSMCRNHNVDIIHTHDAHSHTYAYHAARLGLKPPIVVSRKVDFPPRSTAKYLHPQISKIICVSDCIQNVLKNKLPRTNHLVTIHDGIDIEKRSTAAYSLRTRFNISSDSTLIANLSAMADHKDYPTFLRTAQKVYKENNKTHFLIIGGDGGVKHEISQFIERYDMKPYITVTGFIKEAHKHLEEIDIFLFTSKTEGLGSTLLDAMLYETPIVSTDAGGIPEIITDGYNGLLCQVGDEKALAQKINSLIQNKTLGKTLSYNASRHVLNFSAKVLALKTTNIYKEVLNIL